MRDLKDPRWICLKGLLFLALGLASAAMLLIEHLSLQVAGLLVLAIWCFCRFYYFAFYVIEKYVDPRYRFSGLWSAVVFLWSRRRGSP